MKSAWSERMEEIGASPAKLGFAGFLLVVLIVSAVVNFGSGGEDSWEDVASGPRLPASARQARSTSKPSATDQDADIIRVKYPHLTIEEIVRFDPFAAPEFRQPQSDSSLTKPVAKTTSTPPGAPLIAAKQNPKAKPRRSRIEKHAEEPTVAPQELIDQVHIDLIIKTPEGMAAHIGDRLVRVGDQIDGWVITHIDMNGIAIEAAPDAAGRGQ